MALSILDGNQSATTLSTILSSGQHITAHTVISLGTQAITDVRSAVSGSVVSIPSLPAISGTVNTRNNGINNDPWVYIPRLTMSHPSIGSITFDGYYRFDGVNTWGNTNLNSANAPYLTRGPDGDEFKFRLMVHDEGNEVEIEMATVNSPSPDFPASMEASGGTLVSGSLTFNTEQRESYKVRVTSSITVGNSVTIGSLPALVAGTAQIGSVTASISNFPATQAISIASVTIGNSITISSLPALAAGTAQIGSVTVGNSVTIGSLPAISGTVTANTFALQGTAVTTSNFTSTTASTVLASFNATREVLTIFNEGAGNLHIAPGATCTTIAYQVRLSAGDYYEVPNHQTTITHSAVYATAGTARVTEVS
jgi:hypothetical protein